MVQKAEEASHLAAAVVVELLVTITLETVTEILAKKIGSKRREQGIQSLHRLHDNTVTLNHSTTSRTCYENSTTTATKIKRSTKNETPYIRK